MNLRPFSTSKISLYKSCPLAFKFRYVDKIKIPTRMNIALYNGSYIHSCLELGQYPTDVEPNSIYTIDEINKSKAKYDRVKDYPLVKKHLEHQAICELEFGLKIQDDKIVATDYNYYPTTLFIGKIDRLYKDKKTYHCIDWKTGKPKEIDKRQAMFYMTWIFTMSKHAEKVICYNVFVEYNIEDVIVFTRDDYKKYLSVLMKEVIEIENTTKFIPNATPLCTNCDYFKYDHCKPKEQIKKENEKCAKTTTS